MRCIILVHRKILKKKIMKISIPMFLTMLIIACSPKEEIRNCPIPIINSNPNGFYEVVWQVPLLEDTTSSKSITPEFYGDNVIYSALDYSGQNPNSFTMRNKETGELMWNWNDQELGGFPPNVGQFQYENYLVLSGGEQVFVVNTETGEKEWNSEYSPSRLRIGNIEDRVYFTTTSGGHNNESCTLTSSPVKEEQWKDVLTLTKADNDGYAPGFGMPVSWVKPNGDTLLLFQNRSYNFSLGDGKIDFYAFNLTQDSVEWVNYDITVGGNSSIYQPVIYGNKVYFQGAVGVHCFDILTGEELWLRKEPGYSFANCRPIIAEDKLIFNPDGSKVFALDPETGATIWDKDADAHGAKNMVYHKGKIYFVAGSWDGYSKLYALDASDGTTLFAKRTPNHTAFNSQADFDSGIAIDSDLGYLYANDREYFMCIKLTE
jgi:outer membrane protein assembly factor BamB